MSASFAPRIYTRWEVARHNSRKDCWLIAHGRVYNLTAALADAPSHLCDPILTHAGDDVSHWFTSKDGDIELKTFVEPATNRVAPYTPEGTFLHVPVTGGAAEKSVPAVPWWKDDRYIIGRVTRSPRHLKIVNTLTGQEHIVEFGDEERVQDMQAKFLEYNAHCESYTWKAVLSGEMRALDVTRTLAENGLPDDTAELERLGLDPTAPENLTTIMLFFSDDLTVA